MHHHRDPFHIHRDRVIDARAVAADLPHPAGCNCWLCYANADDSTPPEGDPHEPNDERGWWEEAR